MEYVSFADDGITQTGRGFNRRSRAREGIHELLMMVMFVDAVQWSINLTLCVRHLTQTPLRKPLRSTITMTTVEQARAAISENLQQVFGEADVSKRCEAISRI